MESIRPQTVTLAVLAIMFGLGAAWFAKQILTRQQVPVQQEVVVPPPEATAPLLVVQTNLPKDSRIRDQDVGETQPTVAHIKERHVPDNALKYRAQAAGRIIKVAKVAGTWLTDDDFYPIGVVPRIKVRPGYRDLTLRVDDPAISGTMLHAGDLVDVIYSGDNPDDGSPITEVICSSLEVISPPVSEGGYKNAVISVGGKNFIHLAATPKDAAKLELAQRLGGTIDIALSATHLDEGSTLESPGATVATTAGPVTVTERELLHLPPPAAPPPPPERIVVEEIRGNKFDYAVFTENNERLSEDEVRRRSLPASATAAAAPKKPGCKTCGKGHGATPSPRGSTIPTPPPGGLQPTPEPAPAPNAPSTT